MTRLVWRYHVLSSPASATLLLLSCLCLMSCAAIAGSKPCAPRTLDDLPILPQGIAVHEISSHNRRGGNGDCDWSLYDQKNGERVMFDAVGPGCLRSFWQTDISPRVLNFYFDGEEKPRYSVPLDELYSGKHPAFSAPLCQLLVTGHWNGDQRSGNCFVPIPFAKSLKITCRDYVGFYHFFYEKYPQGTPVTTFTGKEDNSYLTQAFEKQGEELQPREDEEIHSVSAAAIEPDKGFELLNVEKPGTVTRIVIEGNGSDEFLHDVDLQMTWDGSVRPDVLAPVGMFFGSGVRAEDVRSLPTRVEKLENGRVRLTCYFRMPFWQKAHISLVNRHTKAIAPISAEIHIAPNGYEQEKSGYFCALYRDGRTDMGRDWLFCDAIGTGWFVGAVQTMHGQHYCEGNEHIFLDGAMTPQIHGTGSEDYYLACYWPNYNFSLPFAGCVGDITVTPGPACYYRFHLEAPIPFYKSLNASIQHGGNSDIISQYRSVGFYYLRRRPAMRLTDTLDVGSEASEHAHSYKASDSKLTGPLDLAYEGNEAWTIIRDEGRTHDKGKITFRAAIFPGNGGVRLRRRLDQGGARQAAYVYVDGKFAGCWYHPAVNPHLRWYDSEFDLPADLTHGKKSIEIRLEVRSGEDHGPYTDFNYEVLTLEDTHGIAGP